MQISTVLAKMGVRELGSVALGSRLVVIGVAALVLASAAAGAVLAELPGAQQTSPPSVFADAAPVSQLPNRFAFPLLGREVRSPAGSDFGQIAEVLVDDSGRPRAVVVNFGGFLGVGMRKVAVDWRALRFYKSGNREMAIAAVDPDQLARAPQYKADGQFVPVVSPPDDEYGP